VSTELPQGWIETSLGQLATYINGKAFNKLHWKEQGLPIIRIQNLNNPNASFNYSDEEHEEKYKVQNGDLLIAWSASLGAYIWKGGDAWLNQHIFRVEPYHDIVNTRYLYYAVTNSIDELYKKSHGMGMVHVTKGKFEGHEVWLPPLNEQIRIADKLDSVLAKVDAAQARLEKIPTLLKRFRQSVLAAATSGELTREWREKSSESQTDNIDFEELWAAEYKKLGKRFKSPEIINSDETLMEFPQTWQRTTLGQICDVFVGATPSRKEASYWNGDINWVSSSEVAFCRISGTKEKITREGLKNTSTNIHPAGTVMLAMIGQGKTRGQAAILDIDACHNQNTAALRVLIEYLLPEYLYFFLWCQYEQTRKVGGGNNQQALNKSIIQGIAFPYPPIKEQKEIVRRVESLFALADAVEKQYLTAKQRTGRLTQSLLAKAFRGELVPQDPNDEPAADLLKRIQAERQAQAPTKRTRKQPA
jgi:type I restriction enzyme S subunit